MKYPVRLREEAEVDIKEAASWYQLQREGLGHQFLDEVLAALDAIAANPHAYPMVHRDVRRALIGRFPFAIFFTIVNEQVLVMAVMHGSRDPGSWKTRT